MNRLTKALALAGTLLAWVPLLAPLGFALIRLPSGRFMFDYLMPAELGLLAFAGVALLLLTAFREHAYRWLEGSSLVGMIVLFAGVSAAATLTGLASGATKMGGWQMILVMGLYAGYVVALVAGAVGGVLLSRRAFDRQARAGEPLHS